MPKWWGAGPINKIDILEALKDSRKIERNNMSKETWNEQESECYLKAVNCRIKEVFGSSPKPKVSIYLYGSFYGAILVKPSKKSQAEPMHIRNTDELHDFIARRVYRMQS